MKRKILPVVLALVLIIAAGAVLVGGYLAEKYSYSTERVDLAEHYGSSGQERTIVLGDEVTEEKGIIRDGVCYFELSAAKRLFSEIFYADMGGEQLLYTTATDTVKTGFGEKQYENCEGVTAVDYVTCYAEDDKVYVAADYVKQFVKFSYETYDHHMLVYTAWGEAVKADAVKETALRQKGGIKSSILTDVSEGEALEILEPMETWCKVKNAQGIIGYVENKLLGPEYTVQETPVTDVQTEEYTTRQLPVRVSLGWHSIGGPAGNDTLESMAGGCKGMNVIAPTWFSMTDDMGSIRNFGQKSYVDRAHGMGLYVWGVLDNFNYANENDINIDEYAVLSSTASRQNLVSNVVSQALQLGLDGINLDFEGLDSACGPHYVQFLRELSVECRREGLVFSIDNYVPFDFNTFYRLDIQGQIADYVIIMGYDEHWHNSGDPGSVASIGYVTAGLDRTLEDVPAHKVVNALPFYTILWKIQGADVTDDYVTMVNQPGLISRNNLQPVWDEETCQNYAEWTSGNSTYRIWFEDSQSLMSKLNAMINRNIGGMAVWRLGYEDKNIWNLLNTYTSLPLNSATP